jgi:single-strand DNA-binding protein
MARSLNKVQIIGNLGKDPETKYTQGGTAVSNFSVATSSSYKDKGGDWQEKTEWVNITAWGKLAEVCEKYIHKGSKVYVEGRLETQSWNDKQSGEKKYKTVVVAGELIMLDGKSGNGESPERDLSKASQRGGSQSNEDRPIDDSDVPFISKSGDIAECPRKWHRRSDA